MRNLFIAQFFLAALLLGTAGCGDDEDDGAPQNPYESGGGPQGTGGSDGLVGNPYFGGRSGADNGAASGLGPWQVTPYPTGMHAIWGAAANDVWAVGYNNNIIHYDGSAWTSQMSGASGALNAVWGTSSSDVWAAGEGGSFFHWNGTEWTLIDKNAFCEVLSIWGSSSTDVWAVGGECLLHWDGTSWTDQAGERPPQLSGIWGSGPNDVWAVGSAGYTSNGIVVHYNGTTWETVLEGSPTVAVFELTGVWGTGPSDVWVVGRQNIAHWDGERWAHEQCELVLGMVERGSQPQRCLSGLINLWGSAPNDVWAVGSVLMGGSGFIQHWDGTAWTVAEYAMQNEVIGVWGSGPNDVWAVGNIVLGGATLLHYTR